MLSRVQQTAQTTQNASTVVRNVYATPSELIGRSCAKYVGGVCFKSITQLYFHHFIYVDRIYEKTDSSRI